MTNVQKAIRATIKLGEIDLDVFQLPNGKYRMSLTQIANTLGKSHKSIGEFLEGKSPQALPYKDYRMGKLKVDYQARQITEVTLEIASAYWMYWAFKGNEKAQALLTACATEALERRADAAFDIQREEEEREFRFAARMSSKATFKPLMDELKKHGFSADHHDTRYRYQYYIWRFQTALGIESGTRDEINADQLMTIVSAQSTLQGMIMAGTPPLVALDKWQQTI